MAEYALEVVGFQGGRAWEGARLTATPEIRERIVREYQEAVRAQSPERLADLYHPEASHELPFLFPGLQPVLAGKEQIRKTYAAIWSVSDAKPEHVRDVAVYYADDGQTVIVEQVVVGRLESSGQRFEFPGILVVRVRNGAIVHVRDYMDGLAVAHALGRLPDIAAALDKQ